MPDLPKFYIPTQQTPLRGTHSEQQLSVLINLLSSFSRADHPESIYTPPHTKLPLRSDAARAGLQRVAERVRVQAKHLSDHWAWVRAHAHIKDGAEQREREMKAEELIRVQTELSYVSSVLDRAWFEQEFKALTEGWLSTLEANAPQSHPLELQALKVILDLPHNALEEQNKTVLVAMLLRRLVDAQLVMWRVDKKESRLRAHRGLSLSATPSHAEEELVKLADLVQSFSRSAHAYQFYAHREGASTTPPSEAAEAAAALENVSRSIRSLAQDLTADWTRLGEKWPNERRYKSEVNETAYEDDYAKVHKRERERVNLAFDKAERVLDPHYFREEYRTTATTLLERFNSEPDLDADKQRDFRVAVGLPNANHHSNAPHEVIDNTESIPDLLKRWILIEDIRKQLPAQRRLSRARSFIHAVRHSRSRNSSISWSTSMSPLSISPRSKRSRSQSRKSDEVISPSSNRRPSLTALWSWRHQQSTQEEKEEPEEKSVPHRPTGDGVRRTKLSGRMRRMYQI